MFNHTHYVPIIKWKLGEYQALSKLSPTVKDGTTPLIEVPLIGYDFENSRQAKSLEDHIKDFGKRLKAKWATRRCFVDANYLGEDGSQPIVKVMELARAEGCMAVPVVRLNSSAGFNDAVRSINHMDGRGIVLRLTLADFEHIDFEQLVVGQLEAVGASFADTDLVVDFAHTHFQPQPIYIKIVTDMLGKIPNLNRWRTFTLAATSFPETFQNIAFSDENPEGKGKPKYVPFALAPRREWMFYKAFVSQLGSGQRVPAFADYACAHPDPVELDMRLIKPFAKLRYTTGDFWYLVKGSAVRTAGFDQYINMCRQVKKSAGFMGAEFSDGDDYIDGCAEGRDGTGNLTTWVWVASNHHFTKVVHDLASFHAF